MEKPDCYRCKFRQNVPGDAHSQCGHPLVKKQMEGKMGILGILALLKVGMGPIEVEGMEVEGEEHGIRKGWFNWPFNFDPIWLKKCSGFKSKK